MEIFKKKQKTQLNSAEYEELFKKIVGLSGKIDLLDNGLDVANMALKQLRANFNILKRSKFEEEEEKENYKKNDKLYL